MTPQQDLDLSIIIISYNTSLLTANTIDSIYASSVRRKFEIIVVDNGSEDDSVELIRSKFGDVKLLQAQSNLGWAGGNNFGIRSCEGRYVLLLNSDTIVLPGAIEQCISFLDAHPEAGAVGGNLINKDFSHQASYCSFPNLLEEFLALTKLGILIRKSYPAHKPVKRIVEVDWIPGAFLMLRHQALMEVGGLDEAFFMYSDETDLQYRLHQAGWKVYYLPEVNTIHLGGQSSTSWRRRRLVYRGRLLFAQKHYPGYYTFILRVWFILASSLKLPFWLLLSLFSKWQSRAQDEIQSHLAILRMCFSQETLLKPFDPA